MGKIYYKQMNTRDPNFNYQSKTKSNLSMLNLKVSKHNKNKQMNIKKTDYTN